MITPLETDRTETKVTWIGSKSTSNGAQFRIWKETEKVIHVDSITGCGK